MPADDISESAESPQQAPVPNLDLKIRERAVGVTNGSARHATSRRRIIGNTTMSLEGGTTGSGGADDMSWVWPHNITDKPRTLSWR